ncbi:MAG: uracil-DNA glycosylase family protein [Gammaproteobacteria bacterium]|nr:uracil-DNA glycosylase family protein [Gammaproteobacteria bacterium]
MSQINPSLKQHQHALQDCHRCPHMQGPPVTGQAVESPIILVGQAPGHKEIEVHRPFAWTAGKTLFSWFGKIGVSEEIFRQRVYMAAVCRCFPGKNPKGGDRVPGKSEIDECSYWLKQEIRILKPQLVLPVGKLAISQFMTVNKLTEIIGQSCQAEYEHQIFDLIPLPHPSGASTWHRSEPGRTLLIQALQKIQAHPAWQGFIKPNQG